MSPGAGGRPVGTGHSGSGQIAQEPGPRSRWLLLQLMDAIQPSLAQFLDHPDTLVFSRIALILASSIVFSLMRTGSGALLHTKNPAVPGGVFCSYTKVAGVLLGNELCPALQRVGLDADDCDIVLVRYVIRRRALRGLVDTR